MDVLERRGVGEVMDKTQLQRDSRLRENYSKKGLRKVCVWVPVSRADELKKLAAKWRAK